MNNLLHDPGEVRRSISASYHAHLRRRTLARLGFSAAMAVLGYLLARWLSRCTLGDCGEVALVFLILIWGLWSTNFLLKRH